MNLDQYPIRSAPNSLSFEFLSEGPKGEIRKVIEFRKLSAGSLDEIYNLGFGDYNKDKERVDDLIVTNNKDSEKILATVAAAIVLFMTEYPTASVFAQGSTPSQTRFYMMGISKHLGWISEEFEIWGTLSTKEWELFKKDRPYKALLVKRK